ncbi:hypothetical protein M9Y10_016717 [Tritrichomonas musculus]|uniref:Peptidase S8/S53 domain-containing protein n=1 Tax=Tritrichomonas musculus TaxID=1915356 RepID=A0ABR2HWX5_9EUKA
MGRIGSPNYLNFSPYQVSPPLQRIPRSFTSHWFLIQVISSIVDISTFGNSKNIYFSSENMVANGWFRMYINQEQFQYLKESTYFELYPIESKIKIPTSRSLSNKEFYVHASSDWTCPSGSRIISRISDTIFLVDGLNINEELKNDPRILKIRPAGRKQPLNRYTAGFLQTGQQISYYHNNIFAPLRPLHELGLNGTGQIVNVVDSGVDVFNAFFYDPDPLNDLESITNRTNKNHRKVVRIESIVDNTDDEDGHGSHAAGTICGSSFCANCGISQYNGVAPDSKLYFSDIGDSESGELIGTVDLEEQSKIFKELDVHVSSNSWGYSTNEPEIQFNYNKAAFEHPEILYLFATGNNGQYNTVNCPANAKNVLSVTSSDMISAANFEMAVTRVDIVNDTHKITTLEMMGRYIRQNSVSPEMRYFHNLSVIQYQGPDCHYEEPEEEGGEYTVYNCTDTDFDYDLYNGSIVLLDSESGVDEDLCIQALKVAEHGGLIALFNPQDIFHRCNEKTTIPMIVVDNESVQEVLEMGRISIFPSSGTDDPLPGASSGASKGPADSGLRKPEILTPGSHINSARSHGPSLEDVTPSMTYNDNVDDKSGTSMATPAAAGLATIIAQYLNDGFYPYLKKGTGISIKPTSCLLRGFLVNTAIKPKMEENESKSTHRNDVGYGFPFLQNILGFNKTGLRFVDNQSISSNSHLVYTINVDSNSTDLHVTLVYLDPPLNIDNEAIFFADLDLYVKAPNGQIYHGNNVSDGDTFSLIEKVVFESEEISPEGGQFEIHIVSNKFPIVDQKVMFAIVINGPFNMSDIEKNPLEMVARDAAQNDCPRDCSGHGKCENGICVCDSLYTGLACNTSQKTLKDGSSYEEDLDYGDVAYLRVPLNDSQDPAESVSFDIEKSDNLGLLYFCTSFDESPGKFTGADWDCRFACPPNITDPEQEPDYPSFENVSLVIPQGNNPAFFNIAVYTGNYERLKVSINNLRLLHSQPNATQSLPISPSQSQTQSMPISPSQSQTQSLPPSPSLSKTNSPSKTFSESPQPTSFVSESQSPTQSLSLSPIITDAPKKENNKLPLLALICLVLVCAFVLASIVILVVIILKIRKGRRATSISASLIAENNVSVF